MTAVTTATVREATFDVMRRLGMTTIFGNPGSTEIPFLTGLPPDLEFVLGLHEGSVVGIASGYALAREQPAFVNLHTAPGLGNAINAIANARDCGAPLVVVVGQQDRRQLPYEPFLTGHGLERLAGEYPVWAALPVRAQDVPGTIARAHHEALAQRGPALVVVPMSDWSERADPVAAGTPERVVRAGSIAEAELGGLVELVAESAAPAIVVGGGSDSEAGWLAVVELAERLGAPVWQESFTSRVGFPQDHPLFAGHLPWRRAEIRRSLAAHDLVLAVGTSAFKLYLLDEPGPIVAPQTRLAVITAAASEAHRSPCELAVVGPVAPACLALARSLPHRNGRPHKPFARPPAPEPPAPGESLRATHVLSALAARIKPETVLVEETPSSQPELYRRVAVRSPAGYFSAANGGLGFGLAGSIGLRMGFPDRPVVGIVGDGASMYTIQSLWSAARYGVGVLLIVMANGAYAVMDKQAADRGQPAPWPALERIDIAGIARCLGCEAMRIESHEELTAALDEVLPGLAGRGAPLVLEVAVST
jgi:benzoylformate decarboxylase